MELPLGGPALRHYTQSRPRPHRQKLNYRPTRLQETIIECENEDFELMGRVDEGVEEFFTKKVLPAETLKKEDDDGGEIITVHDVAPASTLSCPPPTKTLRRKLGDFFTLKKRRGLKSEPSQEGRPKKASIADFIRPLREVARGEKDKDKVREHDKENEKEKGKDCTRETVQGIPISDVPPRRGEAVPPRRALREGKSQSLILLSGSASGSSRNKKLDGQNSFEQKLHLMLQRIGVSKPQSGETQNQEGEMKKAESEGTIIDNKPEPPSAKPRTMSASSDTRHPLRSSISAHESAGKPPLLPKPVIKPGPPATVSGRDTSEDELGQMEGEPNVLSSKSAEAAPAVSANLPLTISDTAPDSATVLPASKTDTHVSTAEGTAEQDSTIIPEDSSTTTTAEPPSPLLENTLKSTTSPATPTPERDASSLTETPASTLTTSSTSETVILETAPDDDDDAKMTDIPTKLSLPEPNGTLINAILDEAATSTSEASARAGQSDDVVTPDMDQSSPSTRPMTPHESAIMTCDNKTAIPEAASISVSSTVAADSSTASSELTETPSTLYIAAKSETLASPTSTSCHSAVSHASVVSQAPTPVTSIIPIAPQMTDISQNTKDSSLPVAISELPPSAAILPVTVEVSATKNENDENVTADLTCLSNEDSDQKHEPRTPSPEPLLTEDAPNVTAEKKVGDVVKVTEETDTTESKENSESSEESEKKTEIEELTGVGSEVIQDNEAKSKEETMNSNGTAVSEMEAAKDELSGDEMVNEKQQEIKSSDE